MGKISQVSAKYIVHAQIQIDGVVDRPDVIGAIFGQTEGLLGSELELRELQRNGKIGRIEVKLDVKAGKSAGEIINIISMAIQKSITVYELVSYQIGTHPLLTSSPVNNSLIRAAEEIIYKIMQNQKQRDA